MPPKGQSFKSWLRRYRQFSRKVERDLWANIAGAWTVRPPRTDLGRGAQPILPAALNAEGWEKRRRGVVLDRIGDTRICSPLTRLTRTPLGVSKSVCSENNLNNWEKQPPTLLHSSLPEAKATLRPLRSLRLCVDTIPHQPGTKNWEL